MAMMGKRKGNCIGRQASPSFLLGFLVSKGLSGVLGLAGFTGGIPPSVAIELEYLFYAFLLSLLGRHEYRW